MIFERLRSSPAQQALRERVEEQLDVRSHTARRVDGRWTTLTM